MKKILTTASAAVLAFAVTACDGPAENAMEDIGEENAEMVDEQADAMEDAGMITDETEDAMVDEAENQADAMEEMGEAMDAAQ